MHTIQEFQPANQLAPYIACYFTGEMNSQALPESSLTVIPNGCLELIVHLEETYCRLPGSRGLTATPDYMLIGMFCQPYQVHFSQSVTVFAIRFKPEALSIILKLGGPDILESYADIEQILDPGFRDLCHRLRELDTTAERIAITEKHLFALLSKQPETSNYFTKATQILRQSATGDLKDVSAELNISQRQLERKFKEVMGISPKKYLRLLRIGKVMNAMQSRSDLNLTNVAYHCGYFDQAHFTKDFKLITGRTPTGFLHDQDAYMYLPESRELR
ncbi:MULTISPECIES: DUF6597 domain-containing transcriptional factor [Robiginitalea]|uniref:Transcriptional regulator n=1 Tax=Robiginitalea biformata (strain ATCC BAA-864 / DSM 15991 / KCTC 12146 / HTCC2501) TaxID=313596 RepID=A4CGH1_ROBBH|nr:MULTISPECIES: helix-turn-helix domain-containing protein [Robiginitalea]EAR16029.1 transcriptional regulator [Robiginitalea biformata HTCC2501]MDC6354363.1 helix-turn-helix domain-containing protein [Robiginitalea sp. PM2]MDC6374955.1 helix-turn-helix domain-containing protein [Robiginitalea sp. SP8]